MEETEYEPISLDPATLKTEIDKGHMVEVVGFPPDLRYGVVRWIGYYKDINKPIVGLEMVRYDYGKTPFKTSSLCLTILLCATGRRE